jgi:serine/threonine protein phosphatase PrpC
MAEQIGRIEACIALPLKSASIEYGAVTHAGRKCPNQDTLCVTPGDVEFGERGRLFAVADGMGGHKGGNVASHLACQGLDGYYQRSISQKGSRSAIVLCRLLEETFLRTDRLIRREGYRNEDLADMGTTLSCMVLTHEHTIIAHVGDSRIYRLRRNYLTCLTSDHTFVQDMISEGEIDPAQASGHPMRHVLTRAVGTAEPLERVDTRIDPLRSEDRFLLCTDGLYNSLAPAQIAHQLNMPWPARQIASTLVFEAFRAGATDNITAVVIKNGSNGYFEQTKYCAN